MRHTLIRLLLAVGLLTLATGAFAQQANSPMARGKQASPMLLPGMPEGAPHMAQAKAGPNPYRDAAITTRLIPGAHQTHGYEVLVNGRVLVSQPSIPGIAGNRGFRTPKQARRVAALVAGKLRNNQMPPTVSAEELQRLHIEY